MGGYGSGRPSYNQKAEHCRALDIYKMKRQGCLEPKKRGNWVWSRDGEEVARINYHCTGQTLILDYRIRQSGGDWEPIRQATQLTYLRCNYGGQRVYVICPGIVNGRPCGRRVGKLFAGGKFFLCHHCYSIAYYSQSEARYDRMLRRANKLRMALGGEPGAAYWIAPKPKGMWWRTYSRIVEEIDMNERAADFAFLRKFSRHLSYGKLKTLFDE